MVERNAEFAIRLREIYQWASAESMIVFKKRMTEGGYLDRDKEAYSHIHEQVNKKVAELLAEYKDLPRDTKLSLNAD